MQSNDIRNHDADQPRSTGAGWISTECTQKTERERRIHRAVQAFSRYASAVLAGQFTEASAPRQELLSLDFEVYHQRPEALRMVKPSPVSTDAASKPASRPRRAVLMVPDLNYGGLIAIDDPIGLAHAFVNEHCTAGTPEPYFVRGNNYHGWMVYHPDGNRDYLGKTEVEMKVTNFIASRFAQEWSRAVMQAARDGEPEPIRPKCTSALVKSVFRFVELLLNTPVSKGGKR